MADYHVIARVGQMLKGLLWQGFDADQEVRPVVGNEEAIVVDSPSETARDSSNRLSVFLYQITEDPYMKNAPMVQGVTPSGQAFPPLALDLHYLITPFVPEPEGQHLLLGKVMQVFYDNATLTLEDRLTGQAEPVRLVLNRLTLEEHTRVWDALREPYRLSIAYIVRVPRVASGRQREVARVGDRTNDYGTNGNGSNGAGGSRP